MLDGSTELRSHDCTLLSASGRAQHSVSSRAPPVGRSGRSGWTDGQSRDPSHAPCVQAQVSGQDAEEELQEHCGAGRAFKKRRWALGVGPLSVTSLGWGEEDAGAVKDEEEDEEEEEEGSGEGAQDHSTEGMDTPVHRAAVRAYEKALDALAEVLRCVLCCVSRATNPEAVSGSNWVPYQPLAVAFPNRRT